MEFGHTLQCCQVVRNKAYYPNVHPKQVIAAERMIQNLSMKIGEVDSGLARLLAMCSNLAKLEST